MPKSNWELWGIIIAIIEFDINFYVYNQTKSALNILIIMVASLILALAFIISNIYYKIKDLEENQDKFNQKLIRDKELEDIRLDIREIKREMFKKK
ncbi:hypothetical protein COU56_04780 [Candidatus Pacearchaeota archaeon CG10_big_fil_rev_8_21_14_0_10_31_9]|nr:MAG: hypothetical protein AUJ63_05340 [Candidatus Pacearchaeota archaeon CG1_02_35_32]PIN91727.1 MAG: hypothetical protein COU56_04780 [Candidatus Pacearchaeota archaeon CG10_big_fil_rev_8_21_14_0_10_31_9]PIZ82965.1 MAG: hypothetical protein COX97_02120 [Candidatus Pacearchaeota archaeon CG_4_10_14_0_2_um_filter_05_32_18]